MLYRHLLMTVDGAVGQVLLDRPDAGHALSRALLDELAYALEALDRDESIRAGVLGASPAGGEEPVFCVGADLEEWAAAPSLPEVLARLDGALDRIARVAKPLVAAVGGRAEGAGAELLLRCDLAVATDRARIAFPETAHGLLPTPLAVRRLAAGLGPVAAADVVLAGRVIGAADAHARGLVSAVVPAARLLDAAREAAEGLARRAPLAVQAARAALLAADPDAAARTRLAATSDAREGVRAARESRHARFRGT